MLIRGIFQDRSWYEEGTEKTRSRYYPYYD